MVDHHRLGNFCARQHFAQRHLPAKPERLQQRVYLSLPACIQCLWLSNRFAEARLPRHYCSQCISPGTDGFNDYFEIRGLPAHSKLEGFNRWGQIVFKADNYRNNWDAAELNDDTYYYIINTPPPENKSYHGHIRVIKEKK